MLQSNHLSKLLLIAALFFCFNTGSFALTPTDAQQSDVLRQKLKEIYTSQIGVREKTNSNDGPQVEQYLKYTGLTKGSAWCSAFVCWCLAKAGIPNPKSAWSPSLFPPEKVIWEKKRVLIPRLFKLQKKPPRAGDVFGLFFPEKKRIAHCGFIDTWSDKWVVTVEGNTNESGNREGDGVYRKRRLQQQLYCVASYVK